MDYFATEEEKRILGAVLPSYEPYVVRRQKPVKAGNRLGVPPWIFTEPKNSLEVPFGQDAGDMFYRE